MSDRPKRLKATSTSSSTSCFTKFTRIKIGRESDWQSTKISTPRSHKKIKEIVLKFARKSAIVSILKCSMLSVEQLEVCLWCVPPRSMLMLGVMDWATDETCHHVKRIEEGREKLRRQKPRLHGDNRLGMSGFIGDVQMTRFAVNMAFQSRFHQRPVLSINLSIRSSTD